MFGSYLPLPLFKAYFRYLSVNDHSYPGMGDIILGFSEVWQFPEKELLFKWGLSNWAGRE